MRPRTSPSSSCRPRRSHPTSRGDGGSASTTTSRSRSTPPSSSRWWSDWPADYSVEVVTDELASLVDSALARAAAEGAIALQEPPRIAFERPKRREHGDWATNVALVVSRGGAPPRAVAEAIVDR